MSLNSFKEEHILIAESSEKATVGKRSKKQFIVDFSIWLALTGYLLAVIALGRGKAGFELACVVYCFISLKLLARHVSMSKLVYAPISRVANSMHSSLSFYPTRFIAPTLIFLTFIFLGISAATLQTGPSSSILARFQSILGIIACLGIMYIFSRDRAAIPWYTVGAGLLTEYFIAIFVLKSSIGQAIFNYISAFVGTFLGFSSAGLAFIIGEPIPQNFATSVFPAIVFFCSFISIVYYLGGMQYLVAKLAWLFVRLMGTSGAESAVACASPFVGQGESALLVGPFVQFMTRSELHSTMTSGFATIAGSVLIFYLTLVRDPKTILCSCVMSIPASLLLSKMRYPEDEESISKGTVSIPASAEKEANFLHAATNGSAMGMQLVILIAGSLLAIVSLYAAVDYFVGWAFGMVNIFNMVDLPLKDGSRPQITIQFLLSFIFAPMAWLIGMPWSDARKAGEVMASKMVINEFVAYSALQKYSNAGVFTLRSQDLLSFALCGFANFASMGIQIGALGAIAPSRTKDLAELAFSAMLTGTLSTWLTASIAGTLL